MVRKELVWLPTRAKARAAETRAIRKEKPLYDRSDRRARLTEEELRDRRRESAARAAATLAAAVERMHGAAYPMGLDTRGLPEFEDDDEPHRG